MASAHRSARGKKALVRFALGRAAARTRDRDPRGILDLGSGWGASRALFHEVFPRTPYFGINLSPRPGPHVARQATANLPRTEYVVARVEDRNALPWDRVDLLFSIEAAFHFEDNVGALLAEAAARGVKLVTLFEICVEDPSVTLEDPLLAPSAAPRLVSRAVRSRLRRDRLRAPERRRRRRARLPPGSSLTSRRSTIASTAGAAPSSTSSAARRVRSPTQHRKARFATFSSRPRHGEDGRHPARRSRDDGEARRRRGRRARAGRSARPNAAAGRGGAHGDPSRRSSAISSSRRGTATPSPERRSWRSTSASPAFRTPGSISSRSSCASSRAFAPGGLLRDGARVGSARSHAAQRRDDGVTIRALQFAFFWHDIRACRRLSPPAAGARSRSEREVRRALAWLGLLLRLRRTHAGGLALPPPRHRAGPPRQRRHHARRDVPPLLAIADQMCGPIPRARSTITAALSQALRRQEPLLSNALADEHARHARLPRSVPGPEGAARRRCFLESFALDGSRHHIQIYGVHAVPHGRRGARRRGPAGACAREGGGANERATPSTGRSTSASRRSRSSSRALSTRPSHAPRRASFATASTESYAPLRPRSSACSAPPRARAGADDPPSRPSSTRSERAIPRGRSTHAPRSDAADWKLSQLAEQLSEALRSHFDFDPSRPPTVSDLLVKLSRTFKASYVISARATSAALKASALRDHGLHPSSLTTEVERRAPLRLSPWRALLPRPSECNQTSEFRETLAIGVLFERLDPLSESLVKAAFRLVLSQYVFVHSIRISRDIQAKQQRAAAVGTLAQMLAHDVRRPFRMLRAAIDLLERARDPSEFRRQAALVLPEVKLATDTADGLIADVMEDQLGRRRGPAGAPSPRPTSSRSSLTETLRGYPTADVSSSRTTCVMRARSTSRRRRCSGVRFSNIVANALQAMDHHGRISVRHQRGDRERGAVRRVPLISERRPTDPRGGHPRTSSIRSSRGTIRRGRGWAWRSPTGSWTRRTAGRSRASPPAGAARPSASRSRRSPASTPAPRGFPAHRLRDHRPLRAPLRIRRRSPRRHRGPTLPRRSRSSTTRAPS